MGLSETLLELSNQIVRRAKENKEKGIPDPYNDMLDAIKKNLAGKERVFDIKPISGPLNEPRDFKSKDRRSKRQKRLEENNK